NQRDDAGSNNTLLGNFKADLKIIGGLIWSNVLSCRRKHWDRSYYMARTDFASFALGRGFADRTALKHIDKILESYLNYNFTRDLHSFDAMAGYSYQRTKNDDGLDRKSTRLNSSHVKISYAVFCLKKKKIKKPIHIHLNT